MELRCDEKKKVCMGYPLMVSYGLVRQLLDGEL